MRKYTLNAHINEYMQFVATNRNNYNDWQFFCIMLQGSVSMKEVMQCIDFHFKSSIAWSLEMKTEILIFTEQSDTINLMKLEKGLLENFSPDQIRLVGRRLDPEGLVQFCKYLEPYIANDNISQVIFSRMSRTGNKIMVVDDDKMVLKQMERILVNFGNVITFPTAESLIESYLEHAPDILFLDIHIGRHRGNELLKRIRSDLDPYAHVTMISNDTKEEMVMDIKQAGANGFVVKPLEKSRVYQHVMRAPTIATKAR